MGTGRLVARVARAGEPETPEESRSPERDLRCSFSRRPGRSPGMDMASAAVGQGAARAAHTGVSTATWPRVPLDDGGPA